MKKIFSVLSLILIFALTLAVPTFAETEERDIFTPPAISPIYYANDLTDKAAPIIDGEITEGEYGDLTAKLVDHLKLKQSYPENGYAIDDERVDYCSESFDFYIAYDQNFIYLAFIDYGSKWDKVEGDRSANFTARNNYNFGIGFELEDVTNYFSIAIEGSQSVASFSDGKVSNFTTVEEGLAGIVSELHLKKYLKDDPTKIICDEDITTISGNNKNSTEGQYIGVCEIKIDKSVMLERVNQYAYTEFEELPNAMYFHMTARSYVLYSNLKTVNDSATSYNKYFAADMRETKNSYVDYGLLPNPVQDYFPSIVVFGEEGTQIYLPKSAEEETEPPVVETEPNETEPEITEAPTNEAEVTDAPTAETPTTDAPENEGGCGSSMALAGISLVAALGTCTAFVAKKKED